jgi:ferric iron reductase protein FhuF
MVRSLVAWGGGRWPRVSGRAFTEAAPQLLWSMTCQWLQWLQQCTICSTVTSLSRPLFFQGSGKAWRETGGRPGPLFDMILQRVPLPAQDLQPRLSTSDP